MPLARLNGHDLYYEEHGDGDALVLLHGDYGCTRSWAAQVMAFSGDHHVVVYDRRGFGRSSPQASLPPDFYDRDASDLCALLDYLSIERAHLVGQSGGGTVALLAAARYPARARSVVASGAHSYVEPLTLAYVEGFIAQLRTPHGGGLQRAGEACHGARWCEVGEMFAARWLDTAWRDWNILPELADIQCPVLLMQGSEDGTASVEQFAAMAGTIAGARTRLVAGAGHAIHRQMAAAFNEEARAFLAVLPAS